MRTAREASESRAGFSRTVLRAGNSYCLGSRPWAANKPMSAWKRLAVTALAWRWRCSRRATSSALSTRPRSVISPAPSSVATRPTRSMPHLIREYAELFKPEPWAPPSPPMRRLCELQTVRAGIIRSRTEWKNRSGSGLSDSTATKLAAATITHFTRQLEAIDRAIGETIDQDAELHGRRELLLSVIGVGETLAASLLAEMPEPGVLRRSGEMVAYAGLNPSHHRSGSSIDRPTRISKIGNATLRSSLYMPELSAMRFNPAVAALVARLKSAGRLKPKQIVVAAMRKLLVLCFGVLKTGKRFDLAIAMPA